MLKRISKEVKQGLVGSLLSLGFLAIVFLALFILDSLDVRIDQNSTEIMSYLIGGSFIISGLFSLFFFLQSIKEWSAVKSKDVQMKRTYLICSGIGVVLCLLHAALFLLAIVFVVVGE